MLGEMQGNRANDFSKIQGRFRTRLSLSSANVDEVIQERLLAKRDEVRADLEAEYARQGDILKNQLSFKDVGTTFPQFRDADDFVRHYPFAPYQFKLLQKIFESIRKAGATGLHLAQGERSLLDAFQHAGQSVSNREVGILGSAVPLLPFPLRASSTPPSNAPSIRPETMRVWKTLTPGSSKCSFSSATSMKSKAMSITSSPCALIRSTQTASHCEEIIEAGL